MLGFAWLCIAVPYGRFLAVVAPVEEVYLAHRWDALPCPVLPCLVLSCLVCCYGDVKHTRLAGVLVGVPLLLPLPLPVRLFYLYSCLLCL
jgi:hypothetical protein